MGNSVVLSDVKNTVKTVVQKELRERDQQLYKIEYLIDNPDCFRVIIEWKSCVGEIFVDNPYFAPYRFVSFTILSISDEFPIYCWYDSEGDMLEDIEKQIKLGIQKGFNYE